MSRITSYNFFFKTLKPYNWCKQKEMLQVSDSYLKYP